MPLHQAGIEKQILRVFYIRHQKDGLGDTLNPAVIWNSP